MYNFNDEIEVFRDVLQGGKNYQQKMQYNRKAPPEPFVQSISFVPLMHLTFSLYNHRIREIQWDLEPLGKDENVLYLFNHPSNGRDVVLALETISKYKHVPRIAIAAYQGAVPFGVSALLHMVQLPNELVGADGKMNRKDGMVALNQLRRLSHHLASGKQGGSSLIFYQGYCMGARQSEEVKEGPVRVLLDACVEAGQAVTAMFGGITYDQLDPVSRERIRVTTRKFQPSDEEIELYKGRRTKNEAIRQVTARMQQLADSLHPTGSLQRYAEIEDTVLALCFPRSEHLLRDAQKTVDFVTRLAETDQQAYQELKNSLEDFREESNRLGVPMYLQNPPKQPLLPFVLLLAGVGALINRFPIRSVRKNVNKLLSKRIQQREEEFKLKGQTIAPEDNRGLHIKARDYFESTLKAFTGYFAGLGVVLQTVGAVVGILLEQITILGGILAASAVWGTTILLSVLAYRRFSVAQFSWRFRHDRKVREFLQARQQLAEDIFAMMKSAEERSQE